jgi:NAD-reducing hydrogenase small subunit
MGKVRLATIWLDGCSGCHMSFLDMDQRLLALADKVDLVYSPLVDTKEFPQDVDITVIEGAVGNEEDLRKLKVARERSKVIVSLGDCAVTGNVSALRNLVGADAALRRAYVENASLNQGPPSQVVPKLLPRVSPIHEVVKVDVFMPGCPPSADVIHFVLGEALEGRLVGRGVRMRFG